MAKGQKPNALAAALDSAATDVPASEPTPTKRKAGRPKVKPSRVGTVLVAGHFHKEVKKQLKILAAEEETTSQGLLEEALQMLFKKKGVSVPELNS